MANLTLIYELADALYRAGYEDKGECDFDPLGTAEWQAVVDALSAAEDRARRARRLLTEVAEGGCLDEGEGYLEPEDAEEIRLIAAAERDEGGKSDG